MKLVIPMLIALFGTPAMGETPEEVQQRLEEYRQRVRDTEIYLQQKKERDYAETWQRYGTTEVKRTGWRRQADGTWITEAKFDSAPEPPKRFDQSLDELVRTGVLTPSERNLVRGGGSGLAPLDEGAFFMGCRTGSLSSQECRSGISLRWGLRGNNTQPNSIPTRGPNQISVSCKSLVVNTYRDGKWGTWDRPKAGDPYEQLVIDRCSSPH